MRISLVRTYFDSHDDDSAFGDQIDEEAHGFVFVRRVGVENLSGHYRAGPLI